MSPYLVMQENRHPMDYIKKLESAAFKLWTRFESMHNQNNNQIKLNSILCFDFNNNQKKMKPQNVNISIVQPQMARAIQDTQPYVKRRLTQGRMM